MLTNKEANSMMAQGLVEDATAANNELNRQIVAVSNFMWRTDQLLWRRNDLQAGKTLQKIVGITSRMSSVQPEMAKEIRIRAKLIADREKIFPLLNLVPLTPNTPTMIHALRFESWHVSPQNPEHIMLVDYVREQCFGNDYYFENDNRDLDSNFILGFVGDELVCGARWRITHELFDDFQVALLDQIFVSQEFRARKLGTHLFDQVKLAAKHAGLLLFLGLKKSWKLYPTAVAKLSTSYRVYKEDVFVRNLNCDGGVILTLMEPTFKAM